MGSRTKNADKRKREGRTGSRTAAVRLGGFGASSASKPIFDAKKDDEREAAPHRARLRRAGDADVTGSGLHYATIDQKVYYVILMYDPRWRRYAFVGKRDNGTLCYPSAGTSPAKGVRDGLATSCILPDERAARSLLKEVSAIYAGWDEAQRPTFQLLRAQPRVTFEVR